MSFLTMSVVAANVELGDKLEDVKFRLGVPRGEVAHGDHLMLIYERGTIDFFEGYVVKTDMVSDRELAERNRREKAASEKLQRRQAQRQRSMNAKAEAEIEEKLADEEFLKQPWSEQIKYWDTFKQTYPGVPLPGAYDEARQALAKEEAAERERVAQERQQALAAAAAQPNLSSSKRRKASRRIVPGQPVETAPYTADYRPLGGDIDTWPYSK